MGVLDWNLPGGPPPRPQAANSPQQGGGIERLCQESGWVYVSREADLYRVRSGDHQWNVYVDIRASEAWSNLVFQSWLQIRFSLEKPPAGLFARLLLRSLDLRWASWKMSIGQSCEACLCVVAHLPKAGMHAGLFREVCEEIAGEIRAFHQELRDKFSYGMGEVVADSSPHQTYRNIRDGLPGQQQGGLPGRQGENVPGIRYVK